MTLSIHKMHTHCRSPKSVNGICSLVDEVARGPLAAELSAQLGPSLDHLPEVVCLRTLRVRLRIPAQRLTATTLANAWAREFTLVLHRALAYPDGDGSHALRRFPSHAAYRAALIWHLATKGSTPCWEFPELEAFSVFSPAEAARTLLFTDAILAVEIIEELARSAWLDSVLMLWDEPGMEPLLHAIAAIEAASAVLTLTDLIELGRTAAVLGAIHTHWTLASRHQALRLWLRLSRRFSIRAVWHGLRLLVKFLEEPALLEQRDLDIHSARLSLGSAPIPFPSWCTAIVAEITTRQDSLSPLQDQAKSQRLILNSVLDNLRPLAPSSANPAEAGKWVASDCAGILLLLSIVRRLDFWPLAREPEFVRFGGLRALSFLLAAIGMTLIGKWRQDIFLESAVALFAGIFADLDRVGMQQFFAEADVRAVASVVSAESWDRALAAMAEQLTRSFAQRIRGFRQASHDAVIRQFIRIPGRILVEERRMLVVLEPSPLAAALHISGADEPLEGVEWLTERRVEFVLEGL